MSFRGMKLSIVLMAAVITLAAFLGGQRAIAAITIDKPLGILLANHSELTSYEVDKQAHPVRIKVGLKPSADLKSVYDSLYKDLSGLLGDQQFTLEVTDNRSQLLTDALYEMHYAVREGLARGNFTEMSAEIKKIVEARGIESYALWVDDHRVYLQLRHGDSALFEIYDRTTENSNAGA